MLGLLEQKAFGNEHRHGHVLVSRGLETAVQFGLHALPEGVAVGLDDHAAAHGRVIDQVGLENNVGVPLREILAAGRDVRHKFLLVVFLAHVLPSKKIPRPCMGEGQFAVPPCFVLSAPNAGETAGFLRKRKAFSPRAREAGAITPRAARLAAWGALSLDAADAAFSVIALILMPL